MRDGALGDGLARGLAGQNFATFDALGAPFRYSLGDFSGNSPGPSVVARLRRFMATQPGGDTGTRRPSFGGLTADALTDGPGALRLGFLAEPAVGAETRPGAPATLALRNVCRLNRQSRHSTHAQCSRMAGSHGRWRHRCFIRSRITDDQQ